MPEQPSRQRKVALLGDTSDDWDSETVKDRLAIGLLGEEVRDRWVCRDCAEHRETPAERHRCVVYVECYRDGQGSTFALCDHHLWLRLGRES